MLAENGLAASDLRSAFAIVEDCRDLGCDCRAWQSHAVEGLSALLRAQVIISANFVRAAHGPGPRPLWTLRAGWAGHPQRRAWEAYVAEVPVQCTPEFPRLARDPGAPVLVTRDDLWHRDAWYRSAAFNQRHKAAGIDDYIMSIRPVTAPAPEPAGRRLFHSLWVHRAVGDRPFSRREAALLGFVHARLARHVGAALAAPTEPDIGSLSPRRREVLSLLLRGHPEKQIASSLGLSRPTVHEHVSALYRHFAVSSRPELMARFVGRASPDTPPPPPPPPPSL